MTEGESSRPRLLPGAWRAAWVVALAVAAALCAIDLRAGLALALVTSAALGARAWAELRVLRGKILALAAEAAPRESLTDVIDQARERLSGALARAESERDDLIAILESTGEGILVLGSHLRVERVNDAARRLLELPVDAPGRTLHEVRSEPRVVEFAEALLRGEEPSSKAVELSDPTGSSALLLSGNLVPSSDLRRRAVLVLHDLTDLRHLERVRTDFVANVTHELRSPLSSIQGYAETLQEDLEGVGLVERDCVERILRNARRMGDVIRDLIELSRLEHATGAELEAADVAELVRGVVDERRDQAAEKDLELVSIVTDLPKRLSLDRGLLRQALVNLVDNAIKYAPRGGHVRVEGKAEDEHLRLRVVDDGPGVPPEHQARIFERFYRVDTARSRALGGTGLGLAIVKHAAALHGGVVRLRSRPGEETVFELQIPAPELREES
jgi:two-component system phosphate regulon sensor histidine kinase PhoR